MTESLNRVLLVEDKQDFAANIIDYLEARGFTMDCAYDGVTGLHLAVVNEYDIIVLDIMLPGIDGLTICERLRRDAGKQMPILMLTARDTLADKLAGFSKGADDYLVKPFDLPELEARLRALILRGTQRHEHALVVDELTFHPGTLEVRRAGQAVVLNHAARTLLELLMREYPNVVSKERLEQALWGDDMPDTDNLRSHIYALRSSIDREFEHKMLVTVHRYGYRLVALSDGNT